MLKIKNRGGFKRATSGISLVKLKLTRVTGGVHFRAHTKRIYSRKPYSADSFGYSPIDFSSG
jgi:hypothetical protein